MDFQIYCLSQNNHKQNCLRVKKLTFGRQGSRQGLFKAQAMFRAELLRTGCEQAQLQVAYLFL